MTFEFHTVITPGMDIVSMVCAEYAARRYDIAIRYRNQLRYDIRRAAHTVAVTSFDVQAKLSHFKSRYGKYLDLVKDIEDAVAYYEQHHNPTQAKDAA